MVPAGEMALLLFIGVTCLVFALAGISYYYWKRRVESAASVSPRRCRFQPHHLRLAGTMGDRLHAAVRADGPAGAVFVTFVEEPWVVVSPASGMFPQTVEILVYATHAPGAGKHHVTIRLLPIEGEANAGVLELTVKLKPPRTLPVRSNF